MLLTQMILPSWGAAVLRPYMDAASELKNLRKDKAKK